MKLTPEILVRLQVGLYACGVPPEDIGRMTDTIARELEDDSPIIAPIDSSSAGHDLLERLKKAEAVAEFAAQIPISKGADPYYDALAEAVAKWRKSPRRR